MTYNMVRSCVITANDGSSDRSIRLVFADGDSSGLLITEDLAAGKIRITPFGSATDLDLEIAGKGTGTPQVEGYASLDGSSLVSQAHLGTGGSVATDYLAFDRTWKTAPGGGGSASISTASVPFTDGDTAKRVTITDAAVTATDKLIVTVRRPELATDGDDRGYIFLANVVRVASGSFDLRIVALDLSGDDTTVLPPNETITVCYQRAA